MITSEDREAHSGATISARELRIVDIQYPVPRLFQLTEFKRLDFRTYKVITDTLGETSVRRVGSQGNP